MRTLGIIFATILTTLLVSACEQQQAPGPDIYGTLHIDRQTDWVFINETSNMGGPCFGWNTVSIQAPKSTSLGDTSSMCWKIEGAMFVTSDIYGNTKELPLSTMKAFFNKFPQNY